MCGIVGIYTAASPGFIFKDRDIFQQMLYADALRGFHSTGVMIGDFGTRNENTYVKIASIPNALMSHELYQNEITNKFYKMHYAVGHNRYATKGKVTNDNAHPFEVGPITLVHNGTIHNEYNIGAGTYDNVDSHRVAMKLAELSPEEGPNLFSTLAGGFAFVWTDSRNRSFNIIRNDERPLYFCTDEKESYMYFASEKEMLIWILGRNNVKHTEPQLFKSWRHCYFKGGAIKLETRDIEKYAAPVYNHTSTTSHSRHNEYYSQHYESDWERNDRHYEDIPPKVVDLTPNKKVEKEAPGLVASIGSKVIKTGSRIVFQLEDYDMEPKIKRKGVFVPIKGVVMGYGNLEVRGNTTIDIMTILDSCNLLSGEITQSRTMKDSNKIIVDVKEIRITNIKDPDVKQKEEEKPKQKLIPFVQKQTVPPPDNACGFGGECQYDATGLLCDKCMVSKFQHILQETTLQ